MQSPFDTKNKAAAFLDRLSLRLIMLIGSIAYFYVLWRSLRESLIAGTALFALLTLTLMLFERSTLSKRDRLLRERIGGMIALEDLVLMPSGHASETVCRALCDALSAQPRAAHVCAAQGNAGLSAAASA